MAHPPLQHDISVAFDTAKVAPEPFTAPGLAAGLSMRPLRRLANGALRSAIVDMPSGWTSEAARIVGGPQQYFILKGRLRLGAQILTTNAFFAGFADETIPAMAAESDVSMIAIYDAPPAYAAPAVGANTVHVIPDPDKIDPIVPEIDGKKLVGFERRVLWENPANGADTRFLRIPGGFQGRGPNYHPVHEEIYHIWGDGGPDDKRKLSTGWFLWNPAYSVHGYHEHSPEGMVLLEWHDGKWAYVPYKPDAA
ncbi:MAG: hypothetical protein KDE14_06260 [Rhodobacteraceae bacterium]|nr:hypothetical protein [Paracoccaceae bacterium]